MKVAIVSSSFYESTFPLVRHLALQTEIHLYCIIQQTFLSPPMLDLTKNARSLRCGIHAPAVSKDLLPGHVKTYLSSPNISVSLVVFSGGRSMIRDIGTCIGLTRLLRNSAYDIVHFIGTYVLNFLVEGRLKRHKTVHTLHESIDRIRALEPGRLKKIMFGFQFAVLRRKGLRLIFHSANVQQNYLRTFRKDPADTTVIPFGLFEGYRYFEEDHSLNIRFDSYFLFVGYIHPYKGVDLLIEVAQSLSEKNISIPVVIAGKDATGIEERYDLPENVQLINKFLTESEIITLIRKCHAVVLPYTSASQSGIPNTCFCFDKPVIASDLEGIRDIIHHRVNGLLFENGDAPALEQAMLTLWKDGPLYNRLVENIGKKTDMEWADWERIATLTRNWYESRK